MTWIIRIMVFVLAAGGIYLLIAVGLIASQWPSSEPKTGEGLNFETMNLDHQAIEPSRFTARDGTQMNVRVHEGDGPLVVIVHGSGGHGYAYDWLAAEVAKSGAQVLVPDLRGHYGADGPRGDVAYIGQYEDDLADLITAYRKDGQKVILAGHSSGGGLVARFAGGAHGAMMDGAVLMAPFLKHDAPTIRQQGDGWARPLVRRLIGLSMLNGFGITFGNGLTVMEFKLPEGPIAETMTSAYSFRLNTSFAPRDDYLADVAALPKFQVIVGREDEAFYATEFEPLMSAVNGNGAYHILDGVSHLDVFLNKDAADLIADFVNGV